MRIISVDSIKGDELLAKDIVNSNDFVLIPAGTVVKSEYVNKLKDLNIEYIYVKDKYSKGVELTTSLELRIKEQCQEAVRDTLIKYSHQNESEFKKIKKIADEIICDVMKDPEVIYNLSSIREKSESTYAHSLNVCALSVILAFKLKQLKHKIRDIAIGGLLHDIGFTYLPITYSNLKVENCTKEQLNEIKKHIIYGYTVVEKMTWMSRISKDIVISHHERLDGSGYPFHLRGKKISMASRIVAVCDEFDSRVYGNLTARMKVHDVIDYIVSIAGVKFDINVVKAFVDSVAAYPIGSIVKTNKDEKGIVLRQNTKCPTRPVIRIIQKSNGQNLNTWVEKDLTKELTLFITDTILE